MATNLRLHAAAARAVQEEARRTGRSQQQIIREAVDAHLGLAGASAGVRTGDQLIATSAVLAPRLSYRRTAHRIRLARGTSSLDLLDRNDRF